MRLILASRSPQRIWMLRESGLKFKSVPSRAKECTSSTLTPRKYVEALAGMKAAEVAGRVKRGIVIGADTILVTNGEKLGKPRNRSDAFRMLKMISGRSVSIYTGLAIIDVQTGRKSVRSERTMFAIRKLTDGELRAYIKTGEPLDKAGAIAVQGRGAKFISRVRGSRSNAIGLPLELLRKKLREFGVRPACAKR